MTQMTKTFTAYSGLALLFTFRVLAGEQAQVEVKPPQTAAATANVSFGWDSLYMFRGVNALRSGLDYGSSLAWGDINGVWRFSDHHSLSLGSWYGAGIHRTEYQELDLYLRYNYTIGNLTLGTGYTAYLVVAPKDLYSHELNVSAAYQIDLPGGGALTPSLTYFFNIGPDAIDNSGTAPADSSFLMARLDSYLPLPIKGLAASPWVGVGYNFGYNARQNGTYFTGVNHLEAGLSLPFKLYSAVTLSPYVAFSHQWQHLSGTRSGTWWGGIKVGFNF